jgi:hypothetical protein
MRCIFLIKIITNFHHIASTVSVSPIVCIPTLFFYTILILPILSFVSFPHILLPLNRASPSLPPNSVRVWNNNFLSRGSSLLRLSLLLAPLSS